MEKKPRSNDGFSNLLALLECCYGSAFLPAETTQAKGAFMPLEKEIHAYEKMREELERRHNGKYVVFSGDKLLGIYEDLDSAAQAAIAKYGRGPYLIRQVGESADDTVAHVFHLNMRPISANG